MSRFGNVKGRARREDWGTAVEVEEGLFRIRLNNPVSALMVNTYAYRSPTSLVVIDPGWPWTLDALEVALRDLGLASSFLDVDAWLYTHTHIDHMGAAGLLSELSDAPQYTWTEVEPFLDEWHTFQDQMNDWTAWAEDAFVDRDAIAEIRSANERRRDEGRLLLHTHGERAVRNVELLEFDEEFEVADLRLRFVDARGHDPYHGAFYESERSWLFAGDVVIATPTPISRTMDDDLALYMRSLERLADLDADLLLPGHGVQRSGDLSGPFQRSRDYQDRVRTALLEALEQSSEPAGLLELALRATPDGQPLKPRSRWLVYIALLDSHLQALVEEDRVQRSAGPLYRLV